MKVEASERERRWTGDSSCKGGRWVALKPWIQSSPANASHFPVKPMRGLIRSHQESKRRELVGSRFISVLPTTPAGKGTGQYGHRRIVSKAAQDAQVRRGQADGQPKGHAPVSSPHLARPSPSVSCTTDAGMHRTGKRIRRSRRRRKRQQRRKRSTECECPTSHSSQVAMQPPLPNCP